MKALIVDDEALQRDMLKGFLEKQGYSTLTAASGPDALDIFCREPVELVILDHRMPGMTGGEVLREMKSINPRVRVIMITAYSDVATAVTAMKLGADEYLEKPIDLRQLLEKIHQIQQQAAVEQDAAVVAAAAHEGPLPLNIIAESTAMKNVLSLARRVAESPFAVLIRGETGTGKELIARMIHQLGSRRDSPFIDLNCAAIPETLFESELFGHEKGTFTGAAGRRRGRFELADTGTLFLDEIGEMPHFLQPKLLRALQEKSFMRIGGEASISVDVRLVSATNRDLQKMCGENRFRNDLYFRIKVFEIEVPPLRQHREDIAPLVDFFLSRHADRAVAITAEALDMLTKYPFPGNVRELENIIQRTATLARGSSIRPSDLPEEIRHFQASSGGKLNDRMSLLEHELILAALERSGWVQTHAAEQLGINERVLRYKMKKYRISPPPSK